MKIIKKLMALNYTSRQKYQYLLIAVLFANVPLTFVTASTPFGDISKVLILLLTVLEVIHILQKRNLMLKKEDLLLGLLMLLYFINIFINSKWNDSIISINYIFIMFSILIISRVKLTEKQIDNLILISYIALAVYTVLLFFSIILSSDFNRMDFYLFGTRIHPNYQTVVLVFQPAALSYFILQRKIKNKVEMLLHAILSFMNLFVILRMETRAQFLTFLIIALFTLCTMLQRTNKKRMKRLFSMKYVKIGLVVFALCLIYFVFFSNNRIFDVKNMIDLGGSGRMTLWKYAFEFSFHKINLIGIGNMYFVNHASFYGEFTVAHNSYITMMLDIGVVGISVYIYFLYLQFRKLRKSLIQYLSFICAPLIAAFFVDTFNALGAIFQIMIFILAMNSLSKGHYETGAMKQ